MGKAVLIIGHSGSGKSASMRNFKKEEIGLINVMRKDLPFQSDINSNFSSTNYPEIKNVLLNAKMDTIVIDDAGYLMTTEFMDKSAVKGYEKFTELAKNFWELINFITVTLPRERIVYLTMHIDEDASTQTVKPKTIGKLLDDKVCIEGMFTIVLRTLKKEKQHFFRTQSDGYDVAKSPIGMFDEFIDNDLKLVDTKIREFYKIGGK